MRTGVGARLRARRPGRVQGRGPGGPVLYGSGDEGYVPKPRHLPSAGGERTAFGHCGRRDLPAAAKGGDEPRAGRNVRGRAGGELRDSHRRLRFGAAGGGDDFVSVAGGVSGQELRLPLRHGPCRNVAVVAAALPAVSERVSALLRRGLGHRRAGRPAERGAGGGKRLAEDADLQLVRADGSGSGHGVALFPLSYLWACAEPAGGSPGRGVGVLGNFGDSAGRGLPTRRSDGRGGRALCAGVL